MSNIQLLFCHWTISCYKGLEIEQTGLHINNTKVAMYLIRVFSLIKMINTIDKTVLPSNKTKFMLNFDLLSR